MTDLPREVIDVLAEEYPDPASARGVWIRAGGSGREVEYSTRPRDLWQALWLRSARGASVRPAALIRAALEDLPNNGILIRHLSTLVPSEESGAAARVVAALEKVPGGPSQADTLLLLEEWEVRDELEAYTAIVPQLEGRIEPERRQKLRETLTTLADQIKKGALEGLVKAGTSEAVKALLAGLAAT